MFTAEITALNLLSLVLTGRPAIPLHICVGAGVASYLPFGRYEYSDGTVGRWRGLPGQDVVRVYVGSLNRLVRVDRYWHDTNGNLKLTDKRGKVYDARMCEAPRLRLKP